ncbi:EAL domain-containing protein [Rhizobium sp. MHM7A]|uniref:putative bifunctional diguanylate cyclase/phosphodiesterase n=1 Tax=Rhizobium sp. MHM7A TaxID=2583233 RepID=UPI001106776D|nr:EAL domain-containing protein [Rhizobium sp. MHM7A]TLX16150.1 EAL domain-containing protein [Rhizobium sp. MHM7A]
MPLTTTSDIELENETSRRLTAALYQGQKTSGFGFICHAFGCVAAWFATDDPIYFALLAFITVVFAVRMSEFRRFHKAYKAFDGLNERNPAKHWEFRFLLAVSLMAVWIGLLSAYSALYHTYNAATMIAIGISFGTLISIVARNSGSKVLIDVFMWVGSLPLGIALAGMGIAREDIALVLTGALFIPFVLSTRTMAQTVREIFSRSVSSGLMYESMAGAFEAAIRNQPNGMIMFNADDRISVINPRALSLLSIDNVEEVRGISFRQLLDLVYEKKEFDFAAFSPIRDQLTQFYMEANQSLLVGFPDSTHLEFNLGNAAGGEEHIQFVGKVVTLQDVTEREKASQKVQTLANYDGLSNIPSRRHWNEQVLQAAGSLTAGESIAISVFDIDRFKLINDTMGHSTGDVAIRLVASKLQEIKDPRALFGRYGGDEFVLAFCGLKKEDDVSELFDDAFNRINSTYVIGGQKVEITVSGGVYIHKEGDFSLTEAISKADDALRKVKQNPVKAWSLFTRDMELEHSRSVTMKAAIKDAIAGGEFKVVYQPMFSPDGLMFDCCEALARWEHPELGTISPGEFIKIAEDVGAIHAVSQAILLQACIDCKTWPSDTAVSVNLSTLDLAHPEVLPMVKNCLTVTGLEPSRLHIEVTETVLPMDFDRIAKTLHSLRSLGIKIALDDFGTGYSSLSYLNELKLDKVKIDQSFVRNVHVDPQARKLFNAIVSLSAEMEFDIVVEGVETTEQLDVVRESGAIDRVQGYIFSRPETSEKIIERLNVSGPTPTPLGNGKFVKLDHFRKKRR